MKLIGNRDSPGFRFIHGLRFWITNLEVAGIVVTQQKTRANKITGLIDSLLAKQN